MSDNKPARLTGSAALHLVRAKRLLEYSDGVLNASNTIRNVGRLTDEPIAHVMGVQAERLMYLAQRLRWEAFNTSSLLEK